MVLIIGIIIYLQQIFNIRRIKKTAEERVNFHEVRCCIDRDVA